VCVSVNVCCEQAISAALQVDVGLSVFCLPQWQPPCSSTGNGVFFVFFSSTAASASFCGTAAAAVDVAAVLVMLAVICLIWFSLKYGPMVYRYFANVYVYVCECFSYML
jgi:hypothetical protein